MFLSRQMVSMDLVDGEQLWNPQHCGQSQASSATYHELLVEKSDQIFSIRKAEGSIDPYGREIEVDMSGYNPLPDAVISIACEQGSDCDIEQLLTSSGCSEEDIKQAIDNALMEARPEVLADLEALKGFLALSAHLGKEQYVLFHEGRLLNLACRWDDLKAVEFLVERAETLQVTAVMLRQACKGEDSPIEMNIRSNHLHTIIEPVVGFYKQYNLSQFLIRPYCTKDFQENSFERACRKGDNHFVELILSCVRFDSEEEIRRAAQLIKGGRARCSTPYQLAESNKHTQVMSSLRELYDKILDAADHLNVVFEESLGLT